MVRPGRRFSPEPGRDIAKTTGTGTKENYKYSELMFVPVLVLDIIIISDQKA